MAGGFLILLEITSLLVKVRFPESLVVLKDELLIIRNLE